MSQYDDTRWSVRRAASVSVLAALALTTMKVLVGMMSGSLGVLSEGLHSGLDLVAAVITFIAVERAARLPDSDHTYGHEKIENFAALAETVILWVTCYWIVTEAIRRVQFGEFPEPTVIGVTVMVFSLVVDYERSQMLYRTAREHGSQALEADGLHFRMDMLSSIVVIIGLVLVSLGLPIADPLAAVGVSIVILVASLRLARRAFDTLIDRAPAGVQQEVYRRCLNIPGVVECKRVRVRSAGAHLFIEVVIGMDRDTNLEAAHQVADYLERALEDMGKSVDVVVHIEPADHMPIPTQDVYTILSRVVAENISVSSLHNVRIYDTAGGTDIHADIELSSEITLSEAHAISERIEKALRERISGLRSVALHLESDTIRERAVDVTDSNSHIVREVKQIVEQYTPTRDCHGITVIRTEHGLVVSLCCRVDGNTSLEESHAIADMVEQTLTERLRELVKVYVHIEPL